MEIEFSSELERKRPRNTAKNITPHRRAVFDSPVTAAPGTDAAESAHTAKHRFVVAPLPVERCCGCNGTFPLDDLRTARRKNDPAYLCRGCNRKMFWNRLKTFIRKGLQK